MNKLYTLLLAFGIPVLLPAQGKSSENLVVTDPAESTSSQIEIQGTHSDASSRGIRTKGDLNFYFIEPEFDHDSPTRKSGNFAPGATSESIESVDVLNSPLADIFPWFSNDGLRLYSTQTLTPGVDTSSKNLLLMASRESEDDRFESSQIIEVPAIAKRWISVFLTTDEKTAYFAASGVGKIWKSTRSSLSEGFTNTEEIFLNGMVYSFSAYQISVSDDGQTLIATEGESELLRGHFIFKQVRENTYEISRALPVLENFATQSGQLTKDGEHFVFEVKEIQDDGELSDETRILVYKLDSDRPQFEELFIRSSFPTGKSDMQMPSMSGSGDLAIATFHDNWISNDIALIRMSGPQVGIEEQPYQTFSLFPVPASDQMTFKSSMSASASLSILSSDGRLVQKASMNGTQSQINVENLNSGQYTLRYETQNGRTEFFPFIKL